MRMENRMALLVGINKYCDGIKDLSGCENDVKALQPLLEKHGDGKPNFRCKRLVSSETKVTKEILKKAIKTVISKEPDLVVFYFSGHGGFDKKENGFLICQDSPQGQLSDGLHMNWVLKTFSDAEIPEVIIVLDCCHSGVIGSVGLFQKERVELRKGITLLSASTSKGLAMERKGFGVFTSILCEGLRGAAADMFGHITASNLYNMADGVLTPWDQRPIYKSYVTHMKPLRFINPKYPAKQLQRITHHFRGLEDKIQLSPEHLETSSFTDPSKSGIYQDLLVYYHLGLVQGQQSPRISDEAKVNGHCRLTPYGKFFWEAVSKGLI